MFPTHNGQPQCGLVLPRQPSEEEDWSDRNLSEESPPNPQSLENFQVVQSTSQPSLSSEQQVGSTEDYLVTQRPIVFLSGGKDAS